MAKRSRGKRILIAGQPININIGFIIVVVIITYLTVNGFIYLTRDKISIYEVVSGESAQAANFSYTGLAIRDEHVFFAENAGYVDYFARENSRVSKNTVLYSLDETGDVTKALSESANEGESTLTDDDILTIKNQISSYASNYDNSNFEDVYNFKSTLEGTVLQLINTNTLDKIKKEAGDTFFKIYHPEMAGIVTYYIDDFEEFKEDSLNADSFDKDSHPKASLSSGSIVEAGSPIYSIISDEEWYIYIQLSSDDVEKYAEKTGVTIKFLKDNIEASANFSIVTGSDGKSYGKLTLYKYMIRYANERYLDIQILEKVTSGLKIPKTSVVEKDFYVIPLEFGTPGLNNDADTISFWVIGIDEDTGKTNLTPITPQIFYQDDEYYYLDTDDFDGNEVLQVDNSDDTYKLGKTVPLSGVYNVNNGYTTFVQISILSETNEYYIVKSETQYGLEVFDHIVLDGSSVKNKQVIFQ